MIRQTKGHNLKLVRHRSRLDVRKNYFTQRVVDYWNKLPVKIVSLSSVGSFKIALDSFMSGGGIA